jgi:hypothetical protein
MTKLEWTRQGSTYFARWARGRATVTHEPQSPGTAKWKAQVFEGDKEIYSTRQFTADKAQRAAEFNIPGNE